MRVVPKPAQNNANGYDDDANKVELNTENDQGGGGGGIPLPKALTDLLLQTAIFGIDTTAKLSKPTLQLTKDTLLPQIFIPLFREVFEQYVPYRLQHWMKVVPTYIKNVCNLLWDNEAGQSFGQKAGQLGENFVDMTSSDVARQCWIDVTIAIIKLMEALHTPEVKALLDQFAVGACRFIDVLSSGKAKQVWFDAADAIWALIEVVSDPVMVTSLAEGCAQVCFALEHERESLKERRATAGDSGDKDSDRRTQKLLASKRRRERDRRQKEIYPPGRTVLGEGEGRDGFAEALLDGLDGHTQEEHLHEEEGDAEGYYYGNVDDDNDIIGDNNNGPPERVLVPTSSTENIEGVLTKSEDINNIDDKASFINENISHDDNESEITTEIEDLGGREKANDFDDVDTQSSASKSRTRRDDTLVYEQDGRVNVSASLQNRVDHLNWCPNSNDGTSSEVNETAFDESAHHFYQRLNEVLLKYRSKNGTRDDLQYTARGQKLSNEDRKPESGAVGAIDTDRERKEAAPSSDAAKQPQLSKELALFGIQKKYWKVIIIVSVCAIATMCLLWFALGCYGFYVLVINSRTHLYYHHSPVNGMQQQQPEPRSNNNVVIQIVTSTDLGGDTKSDAAYASGSNRVSTISLDDWNQMKLSVDEAIDQSK